MVAHRRLGIAALALLVAFGFWHSAHAASKNALGAIAGTWHLTQVSDGHVTTAPAKPTSLEFVDTSLKADDGTNLSIIKLVKADKRSFFFGSGSATLVGYAPNADARQALSRGPLQHLLFTPNTVNYTRISPHNLVLQSGGYTYTLTK